MPTLGFKGKPHICVYRIHNTHLRRYVNECCVATICEQDTVSQMTTAAAGLLGKHVRYEGPTSMPKPVSPDIPIGDRL
ncbi:MAG: hypothetical protein OXG52_05725 [bacterium]|nr:hypothetical protein [bacterium]